MANQEMFASARRAMVDSQLRPFHVVDERIIAAMLEIPREAFVPAGRKAVAYMDEDIAVAPGRWLMEPLAMARLIQAADVQPTDVVLEIGTGTGYGAAILSRLASTVVALDADADMVQAATANLATVGAHNAAVFAGPHAAGLPAQAPFNVIVVTGLVAQVPDALPQQLVDGGVLLAVLDRGGVGEAVLYRRVGDLIDARPLFNAQPRVLPGFDLPPKFVF